MLPGVVVTLTGPIYWGYNYSRDDHLRREEADLTLKHRGLDFARAAEMFAGRTITVLDDRFDYGESRFITAAISVTAWWSSSGPNVAMHATSLR